MQRENRIFTNKTALIFKFTNLIFTTIYYTSTYTNTSHFSLPFISKKRGENREKSGRTIGAFSKYLRILGEVS